MDNTSELKQRILELVSEYSRTKHKAFKPVEGPVGTFQKGISTVPYAGRVFDEREVVSAVSAVLDFWLTLGPEGEAFENEFAARLGVRSSMLVNSGSSANLVAVATLTSSKLPKERRINFGDEVITAASGFPTTVAPIVQCGAVPVFVDVDPSTANAYAESIMEAYVPGRTKAVIIAHALGNPFDLASIASFCRKKELWLIEDNCDALGSTYTIGSDSFSLRDFSGACSPGLEDTGGGVTRFTGTWGDLSTQSFYPPHHMTLGEGGAVNVISRSALRKYAESIRDWGRDCWCASGKDNTCGQRFDWQLGDLPKGYDHKYVYSHLGYNLKPLDIQAAIGREQLKKLDGFVEARRCNWQKLRSGLDHLSEYFDFSLPTHAKEWRNGEFIWDASGNKCNPSWFGFMLRVRQGAPFERTDLARHLDKAKIGNRMFFGGNLVRQPAFAELRKQRPEAFRVVGELSGSDAIMNQALFVGTFPGLSVEMIEYIVEVINDFSRKHR